MKITRRAIAGILAGAAAVPALAEPQSDAPKPQDDLQKGARERFEKNAQAMAAVKIPIATEPPFHFKP
jgi:hypothetical protein